MSLVHPKAIRVVKNRMPSYNQNELWKDFSSWCVPDYYTTHSTFSAALLLRRDNVISLSMQVVVFSWTWSDDFVEGGKTCDWSLLRWIFGVILNLKYKICFPRVRNKGIFCGFWIVLFLSIGSCSCVILNHFGDFISSEWFMLHLVVSLSNMHFSFHPAGIPIACFYFGDFSTTLQFAHYLGEISLPVSRFHYFKYYLYYYY